MATTGAYLISPLAEGLGTSEEAVRLILSLHSGYLLAIFQRLFLKKAPPTAYHVFYTLAGLSIVYFNFGIATYHSALSVIVNWALLHLLGGSFRSVVLSFIYNMGTLLLHYYLIGTTTYVINFTTPQCVLTFRLIGLAWDIYDGTKPPEKQSESQKKVVLNRSPTLLEVSGYVYHFGGLLVGPQFPMKQYLLSIQALTSTEEKPPISIMLALQKLATGVLYLCLFTLQTVYFPDDYMISKDFEELDLLSRWGFVFIWGRLFICKLVGVWLISEGACILSGLAYIPGTDGNPPRMDACQNVKIIPYELSGSPDEIIQSFNITTNQWLLSYIYKRMRFLGMRIVSHVVTLSFLGIWHGLLSGYQAAFLFEVAWVRGAREIDDLARRVPVSRVLPAAGVRIVQGAALVARWLFTWTVFSYMLVPFALLVADKWVKVHGLLYWGGYIAIGLALVIGPLLRLCLAPPPRAPTKEPATSSNGTPPSDSSNVDEMTTSDRQNGSVTVDIPSRHLAGPGRDENLQVAESGGRSQEDAQNLVAAYLGPSQKKLLDKFVWEKDENK
ncbi:PREDICTED: lysophospholipid acyltransferase 5-like [Branchiostoma belcheri]|uniref:Lysophospholipid acyltransferase 5 n=1 Tax=Branchiostoma belcheri TaxID=7741 RepID=A0A6P5A297_BRABE|nr:PREDICTED: lysophospholipid acyltransferase 5-like [Branchiostoma belcheri]